MNKASDNDWFKIAPNKDAQNFATRRLLHDLKEIQEEKIPTVGVTAYPIYE